MQLKIFNFLCLLVLTMTVNAQDVQWIPFQWKGDTISSKYFERSAMVIPLKIDDIPAKFDMQFDLGAVRTVIYGNSIEPYLHAFPNLQNKIDTSKTFLIQGVNKPMFSNMTIKMGTTSFKGVDIGYYKDYGKIISKESMRSDDQKHIGTLGPDLFQNKILIIDYPNKKIGVCEVLPKKYQSATFKPFKSNDGRPKIPLEINGKTEYVMFDTGSSLFTLTTTKKNALEISNPKIVDSLNVSSWGKMINFYGVRAKEPIKFGNKILDGSLVYYDEQETFSDFYKFVEIWGLTGNIFFLKNTVIIDYKNKIFGVL